MNVSALMTTNVHCCAPHDDLRRAMQIMWECDCGVVPVVDGENKVVGMLTDRDVAAAAYTQGRRLRHIPVERTMAKRVYGVREYEDLDAAETLMRRARVRRIPVLDGQGRIKGILTMNDLARHAGRQGDAFRADSMVRTLAVVSEPRVRAKPAKQPPAQLTA